MSAELAATRWTAMIPWEAPGRQGTRYVDFDAFQEMVDALAELEQDGKRVAVFHVQRNGIR